ncbi:MAG: NUDIX hydrolase [Actinomycetes bacterium]
MDPQAAADELVDVVDLDGRVVGTVTRAVMRAGRLRHRCTFVVVRSSAGEVLVHRRSEAKDLWPGHWDLSAGGVVGAGEDWEPAARRELAEELGVVDAVLEPLGHGSYEDAHVAEVARIWTTVHDGPFSFTDDEVVEARFVNLDELAGLCATQPFVPDSLALALPYLR